MQDQELDKATLLNQDAISTFTANFPSSDSRVDPDFTSVSFNFASDCDSDSTEFNSASSSIASDCDSEFIMHEQQRKTYDVFLSFRGEDTRKNFTCHLYNAFNEAKVKTYMDDQLKKGDEISQALIQAIKDSRVSVVIFSENYAFSKWCLDELSNILKCKNVQHQIVIPVFYNIDPSDVRKQTGSFGQAFAKHEGDLRFNEWKDALTKVANLAGWDSRIYRNDIELFNDIVKDVLKQLPTRYRHQQKGQFGIEEHCKQIEPLLKLGSSEIMILGIWGMGGVGKTTIAKALYFNFSGDFEGCCFLNDVREKSNVNTLCDQLFSTLLGNGSHRFDYSKMSKLQGKKYFIVLDDVATSDQLKKLTVEHDFLGSGSRVIVTTRNKQILLDDNLYEVQGLSDHDSLQLLCSTAFEENQPKDGYDDLIGSVVSYCKGIPLALRVLGASLRNKSKEVWECTLRKLQWTQIMDIHVVLKLSYDDLDPFQKNIFLDIACFFKGGRIDWVTSALEAFDFFPASGIQVLVDKALITVSNGGYIVSNGGYIEMHDLIQEMGQTIVDQESEDLGRRSRLWRFKEVHDVLKNSKGTDGVQGIILDLDLINSSDALYLSSDFLAKMPNMRFLQIYMYWWIDKGKGFNVNLSNGLELFSHKLRYLEWYGFPLESFPPNFCAEQLVHIKMPLSKLKKLWDGVQNLVNLKEIFLEGSHDMIEIPDLSMAKNLEKVYLGFCESLHQLHPSILSHPMLTHLDLSYCKMIESLHLQLASLELLNLNGCSSLKEISVTSTKLKLSSATSCAFSSSMLPLPKPAHLDLGGCKVIESLELHWESLTELVLIGYLCLKEISVRSKEMITLELSGTAISSLSSLSLPKLKHLDLSDCKMIESLHLQLASLKLLNLNGCSSLKEISVTSQELTILKLSGTAIHALQSSILSNPKIEHLDLSDCKMIESLHLQSKSLKELVLDGCSSLVEISVISEEMTKLILSGTAIRAFSSSMLSLPKLTYLDLSDCNMVDNLKLHSKYLKLLHLNRCSSLKEISMTSDEKMWLYLFGTATCGLSSSVLSLPNIEYLYLRGCREIQKLNVDSKSLHELHLDSCSSLKEMSMTSEEITELDLSGCSMIESLHLQSKSLKELVLDGCSSLAEISVTSQELTILKLSGTAIRAFSSSMLSLPKLTYLDLSDCNMVDNLKIHSKYLKLLNLNGCSSLKEISMPSDEKMWLYLFGTATCGLSSSVLSLPNIEYLYLSGSSVESLPVNIKNLSMIKVLNLKDCKKLVSLPELPPSLKQLWLDGCRRLVSLPILPHTLHVLSAFNCISLKIEITQQLVLQHMLENCIHYIQHCLSLWVINYFVFSIDHVMDKCGFCATKSSISIPCLPIPHLCGFICCIILSKESISYDISVSIYHDNTKVWYSWDGWDGRYTCCENPISDHVIFWYHDVSKYKKISEVSDHFNDITFIFESNKDKESIKGCRVFPVYATTSGFKLDSNSSNMEIPELESISQISANESQPREIEAGVGVGGFNNENEDDLEELVLLESTNENEDDLVLLESTNENEDDLVLLEDFTRNDSCGCGYFIVFLAQHLRRILMRNEH